MFCNFTTTSFKFIPGGSIIGLGNGLVPSKPQTISWTNDDPFNWLVICFIKPSVLTNGAPFTEMV